MKVTNIHSREYPVASSELGRVVDTLSSQSDLLWPYRIWPRMTLDRPLSVSASGGHGPIRYFVEEYVPGKRVRFRFTGPKGFDGYHGYEVYELDNSKSELRETVQMNTHGLAQLTWPLIFCPLHNALIEDSFSLAEHRLGVPQTVSKWSWWVKFLRWSLSGGKRQLQEIP